MTSDITNGSDDNLSRQGEKNTQAPVATSTVSTRENLRRYKILVDIFKGYLDTAVRVHTSYYALTGALAAYCLANRVAQPYIMYSFIIPFFLGLTLIYVSFKGMSQALMLNPEVDAVRTGLAMPGSPPVDILRRGLLIMGILDSMVCASLIVLLVLAR
jgi:hypothetical protein